MTAGTLRAHTQLPPTTWFPALHLIPRAQNGLAARELMRQLGVSSNTAWVLNHKLRQALRERAARPGGAGRRLSGRGGPGPPVTGGGQGRCETPGLQGVHTLPGNVQRSLDATCHACAARYAGRSLGAFAYRSHRRSQLQACVPRLA